MKFGEVLAELLEEREISQKKIAEDLNIAPSTMGNYCRCLREPDFDLLKRIAKYFDVTTDYLLDYKKRDETDHKEETILNIYKQLSAKDKRLFLEQGKLLLKLQNRS